MINDPQAAAVQYEDTYVTLGGLVDASAPKRLKVRT